MSKICSIGLATPAFTYQQADIFSFMQTLLQFDEEEARKTSLLYSRSGIGQRHSVLEDFTLPPSKRKLYKAASSGETFPSLEERMAVYAKEAHLLAVEALLKCIDNKIQAEEITHLITVSCTGMSAPGLDLHVIQELRLSPFVERGSVNFMGCYAALHGLKQADYICKTQPGAKVLVVCAELCSLHFQDGKDIENIAVNMLFGDGAAAVLVCHDNDVLPGIHIRQFFSCIEFSGSNAMAWNVSSKGFLMSLSAYVPQLIESGVKKLIDEAFAQAGIAANDVAYWAVHPGGRKILETVERELALAADQIEASYKVLEKYGNMSSPTVLFVLKTILDTAPLSPGEKIVALSFGPGLTLEAMLLEVS